MSRSKTCHPHRTTRRCGTAIMEMALAAPLMAMLCFGLTEYGYFLVAKSAMQAAARDGARQAIQSTATNTTVSNTVANSLTAAGFQNSGYTVTTSPADVSGLPTGIQVTVTVSCNWGSLGIHPLPTSLGGIPTSKQVTASAVMNRE